MAKIPVILQQGLNEGIDKRVLPNGLFSTLKNVRFSKDGRIISRTEYITRTMDTDLTADLPTGNVMALGTTLTALQWLAAGGFLYHWNGSNWQTPMYQGAPVTYVSHFTPGAKTGSEPKASHTSSLYRSGLNYIAWDDGTNVWVKIIDINTGTVLSMDRLSTSGTEVRVTNTTVATVVWRDGTNIKQSTYNSGVWGAAVTVVGGITAAGGFDLSSDIDDIGAPMTTYALVYQSGATQLTAAMVNASGTVTATDAFTAGPGGTTVIKATIATLSGGRVWVVWRCQDGGIAGRIRGRVYASQTLSAAGATAVTDLDTATDATNDRRPVLAVEDATHCYLVFSGTVTNQPRMYTRRLLATATPTVSVATSYGTINELRHQSKPLLQSGRLFIWAYGGRANTLQPGFYLVELPLGFNGNLHMRHEYGSAFDVDHAAEIRKQKGATSPLSFYWPYLWITKGLGGANPLIGAASLEFFHYTQKSNRSHVNVAGSTYISGGFLTQFDGRSTCETGWLYAPEIVSLTESGGGALTALGTYQFVVVYEYIDSQGQRHRSEPSAPKTITLTGGNQTVTVGFTTPALTLRGYNGNVLPHARAYVYRTGNLGRIFNQDTPDNAGVEILDGLGTTYASSASDVSIAANEVLYTQGGALANVMPPACGQVWAGADRLALALLPDAPTVQLSKLIVPGEPVRWADDDTYRVTVSDPVTAVASLDSLWYIFTSKAIYAFGGEGPNDEGQGTFTQPVPVPSETGCIDWRSVVEIPQGLLFQGYLNRLYLLPRGGGSPVWVGQSVRDTMVTYPTVTGAVYLAVDNVVILSVTGTGTTGALLVLDLRSNNWSTDEFLVNGTPGGFYAIGSWVGYLGAGGYDSVAVKTLYAQSAFWSGGVPMTFKTGEWTPFGINGFGHMRKIHILGEYRSDTTLTVEEYPDGATSAGNNTAVFTLSNAATGMSIGDRFDIEWQVPVQKLTSVAFKILSQGSGSGEGAAFHGITMEAEPLPGLSKRAAILRA